MKFDVAGPTPGLCIRTLRGNICTRMMNHEGEHLWVKDTLTSEERLLATFQRFRLPLRDKP